MSWDRERKATAMATEDDTHVLLIDRLGYKKCLWHLHQADRNLEERLAWLKTIDHFKKWGQHRLTQFAYSLTEATFYRGVTMIHKSDPVDTLVLLQSGICQGYLEHRKDGRRSEIPLALYKAGSFLGQTDLAATASRQRPHQMCVRALSSKVKVYYIPRDNYIKFVLKNGDAATSLLRRRLGDLSVARDQQIVDSVRSTEVAQQMSLEMSPLKQSKVSFQFEMLFFCILVVSCDVVVLQYGTQNMTLTFLFVVCCLLFVVCYLLFLSLCSFMILMSFFVVLLPPVFLMIHSCSSGVNCE